MVGGRPFLQQGLVLVAIAIAMTVGVYGLVAGIVKLDDLGLWLTRKGRAAAAVGRAILASAPWLMKALSFAGTAAMFLVGGGILVHSLPALHHGIEGLAPGGGWGTVVGALANAAVGDATEIGRTLRESIEEYAHETPLKRQLTKLSKLIGVVGFGMAAIAFAALMLRGFIVGTLRFHPAEWFFYLAVAVSLTVVLANVWLGIINDAFELLEKPSPVPERLQGISWGKSIAAGLAVRSLASKMSRASASGSRVVSWMMPPCAQSLLAASGSASESSSTESPSRAARSA